MYFDQYHINKTGGTSLIVYAARNKLDWQSGAHTTYAERTFRPGAIKVTALRCPIRRAISMYSCEPRQARFSDWIKEQDWSRRSYLHLFGHDFLGAIATLKTFDHILDTTHLTEQFNNTLGLKYGLPRFDLYENKSAIVPILSRQDVTFLKQRLQDDLRLCDKFNIETI